MTLPVSSYEELLVQVRGLTHETVLLQRQLSSDLFDSADSPELSGHNLAVLRRSYENGKFLSDGVLQQPESNGALEPGQKPLGRTRCDFRFDPHARAFPEHSHISEGIRSGELTARLIAWRSQSPRPRLPSTEEETIPQQANRTSAFFDAFRNSARAPRVESDSYDPYDARETRGAPQCLLVPPSDPPLAGGAVVVKPVALVHASTEPRKRSSSSSRGYDYL